MQGKAVSWPKPGSRRETHRGRRASARLFGAGAVLQPVARGVEDMARSMLCESTSRAVQGRRHVQALQSRTNLAQCRGSCCSVKTGAKRVCRGRSDRGARAGGNRGNQNQSSRKPSRGLRRAVRKMPRPAAQQGTVFEVNRCRCRRLVSHLRVVHAGGAEQGASLFQNEIKVKFFISNSLKDIRARSPHCATTGPIAPTWSGRSARPEPAKRGGVQTREPANGPQSPRR
jgi:hypothetical protein